MSFDPSLWLSLFSSISPGASEMGVSHFSSCSCPPHNDLPPVSQKTRARKLNALLQSRGDGDQDLRYEHAAASSLSILKKIYSYKIIIHCLSGWCASLPGCASDHKNKKVRDREENKQQYSLTVKMSILHTSIIHSLKSLFHLSQLRLFFCSESLIKIEVLT